MCSQFTYQVNGYNISQVQHTIYKSFVKHSLFYNLQYTESICYRANNLRKCFHATGHKYIKILDIF